MVNLDKSPDQASYNQAWLDHQLSFTQHWAWGEVKKGDSQPQRLLVDGLPVTVFVRKLPGIGGQFGYIPRGFNHKTAQPQMLSQIAGLLCEQLNLSHLLIEANVCAAEPTDPTPWRGAGFAVQSETVQPRYSQHLDTTQTDEQLLADMEHDARRRLSQALARDDLKVRENTSEAGLTSLYATIHGVSQRSKFALQPDDYFVRVFRAFANTNMVHMLFVERGDELLYATFALADNGFLRRIYGGPTAEGRKEPAGHLLLWKSIQLARRLHLSKLDLWGVAPYSPDGFEKKHALYGISKFKSSFGGQSVTYLPQLIWVKDRKRFNAYRAMLKTHHGLIKLRKLRR